MFWGHRRNYSISRWLLFVGVSVNLGGIEKECHVLGKKKVFHKLMNKINSTQSWNFKVKSWTSKIFVSTFFIQAWLWRQLNFLGLVSSSGCSSSLMLGLTRCCSLTTAAWWLLSCSVGQSISSTNMRDTWFRAINCGSATVPYQRSRKLFKSNLPTRYHSLTLPKQSHHAQKFFHPFKPVS